MAPPSTGERAPRSCRSPFEPSALHHRLRRHPLRLRRFPQLNHRRSPRSCRMACHPWRSRALRRSPAAWSLWQERLRLRPLQRPRHSQRDSRLQLTRAILSRPRRPPCLPEPQRARISHRPSARNRGQQAQCRPRRYQNPCPAPGQAVTRRGRPRNPLRHLRFLRSGPRSRFQLRLRLHSRTAGRLPLRRPVSPRRSRAGISLRRSADRG
jgi:hypothetical protein